MRLGIIGSGFIAQFQARALLQVRDVQITALLKRSNTESFAQKIREDGLGPAEIYNTIADLCENVDAVAVYVPNFAQVETIRQIAEAKKHKAKNLIGVMIDKPLGRNLREAREICALIRGAGLLSAYFENQIFMGAVQAQRDQLDAVMQAAGGPMIVRSAEEHSGPHMPWFWQPEQSGGGVLLDMGCHSIAVGWHLLCTKHQQFSDFEPIKISCKTATLKWNQPKWRQDLKNRMGVDYESTTPAEDFATGVVTFIEKKTGLTKLVQFTDSWMYDKQGLKLSMEGLGAGYAFEINTQQAPLQIFIGDSAANAIHNAELALEKSTSTRGLLNVLPNEADLYGYTEENRQAIEAFRRGKDAFLPVEFGLAINQLVMAAYLSAEQEKEIDLRLPETLKTLESYRLSASVA